MLCSILQVQTTFILFVLVNAATMNSKAQKYLTIFRKSTVVVVLCQFSAIHRVCAVPPTPHEQSMCLKEK